MDVAKAIGVDEMTILNWQSHLTMPLRSHVKIRGLCLVLGADWADFQERFRINGLPVPLPERKHVAQ